MNEIVLTPAALLDILTKIDELKEYDIGLTEGFDGTLQLQIGNNSYSIDSSDATEVQVTDEVVDTVEQVNMEAYDDIDANDSEYIESGILKELAKTLLVGGLVRLTGKLTKEYLGK